MIRRTSMVCLALLVALAGSSVLLAQGVTTATLVGTVTSSDGTPLPGVTVTVSSPSLLGTRDAISTETGEYIIRGLSPGDYSVKFGLEGMQTVEKKATLGLGTSTRVDASLKMSGTAETITVTASSPTVLETTTVGANLPAETVRSLPMPRTPVAIAALAGSTTEKTPVAGQLNISGGMAYDNAFLVNGVNIQDPIFGNANNLFIEESIAETQVLTSGISAEYGHFTGGVVNAITKSGGNKFTGSLRGDFTKPEWRDETPFENGFRGYNQAGQELPHAAPVKRTGAVGEVYSATLGGPVWKDRIWFFAAVRNQEDTSPAALAVSGVNLPRVINNDRKEGKLTGNITSKHTLQASYIKNPDERTHEIQVNPLTPDAVGLNSKRENEGTVYNYTGVLTNNLFAEARYSEKTFGFRGLGGTSTNIADSPMRSATRFAGNTAGTFNAPYFDATDPEDRNNKQLYGSLSYFLATKSIGSHDIKGGAERFTVTRTGGNSQTSTDYVFYTGYQVSGGAPVFENGRLVPVWNPVTAGRNDDSRIGWWIAERGAKLDIQTDSFYINDRWDLNSHFTFNLGARYENTTSDATGGLQGIDTKGFVPRLAASYDPLADGKYKFDVTYAEYSGRYNPSILGRNTPVGNPALLYGYYMGPAGVGRNFAAGFNPANYNFSYASVPTGNIFMSDDLSSPTNREITFSAGMALPRGGSFKATYIDRDLSEMIDDFVTIDQGCTQIVFQGVNAGCFDNVVYRNTSVPVREYQAVQLQGNYSILRNWRIDGNYTRQLKNDGNYEGEAGQSITTSAFGNRPEIQSPRENPTGHLSQFQRDKIRLWTTYDLSLGRAGTLTTGLIYKYDSAQTFSYAAAGVARSAIQLARNPGYKSTPTQTLFFGERGAGEYNDSSIFDVSLMYGIPVIWGIEPWIKFDARNVLNADALITFNTAVSPDATSPLDSDGLRTGYVKGSNFGNPTAATSYVTPREYFISAGIRF